MMNISLICREKFEEEPIHPSHPHGQGFSIRYVPVTEMGKRALESMSAEEASRAKRSKPLEASKLDSSQMAQFRGLVLEKRCFGCIKRVLKLPNDVYGKDLKEIWEENYARIYPDTQLDQRMYFKWNKSYTKIVAQAEQEGKSPSEMVQLLNECDPGWIFKKSMLHSYPACESRFEQRTLSSLDTISPEVTSQTEEPPAILSKRTVQEIIDLYEQGQNADEIFAKVGPAHQGAEALMNLSTSQ